MNLKISFLSAITLFSASTVFAQDKIYTRDGDVMEVNVKMVGEKNIIYKKASNDGGPDYTINKKEVSRIEYENGDEDVIVAERRGPGHPDHDRRDRKDKPKLKYGNNILAAAPLQITENGPGVGISYERVLDRKRNIVSFYMPLAMAFNVDGSRYDDVYYGGYYGTDRKHDYSFYAMPGLKFYPTGGKGIVRYAVGPNLVFRVSEYSDYYYYNGPYYGPYITYPGYPAKVQTTEFTFGMIINNSLNINPTPHLHMGLEFGIGFSYVSDNNRGDYYYGYRSYNDPEALVQFGFKIGYRF